MAKCLFLPIHTLPRESVSFLDFKPARLKYCPILTEKKIQVKVGIYVVFLG